MVIEMKLTHEVCLLEVSVGMLACVVIYQLTLGRALPSLFDESVVIF